MSASKEPPTPLDHLNEIARMFQDSQGRVPPPTDILRKVGELFHILDTIERNLRPPNDLKKLKRGQLPQAVTDLLVSRNNWYSVASGVAREVGRATNVDLPFELVLPQTRAIINALEAIKLLVCPKDPEIIHFSQLQRIVDRVRDNYDTYTSSKNSLSSIARIISPLDFASGKVEDVPSKSAEPFSNQALNQGVSRAITKPISDQLDRKESPSHEELRRLIGEVNRLEKALQDQRQRSGTLEHEIKESKNSLQNAIEEAAKHRNTLTTDHRIEIERLKANELKLVESHTQSINRLNAERESAVAKIEQRKDHEIKTIMIKHEKDLETNEESRRQTVLKYDNELALQRENHSADKKQIEDQHRLTKDELQHNFDTELKKHRDYSKKKKAQWTEEVEKLEIQLSSLETQHTQRLSEQERSYRCALEKAEENKREQLDAFQAKHKAQLEIERQRLVETEQKWELELAQLAQTHQAEVIKWKQALDKEQAMSMDRLDEQAQKHKAEVEKVGKQRDQLQNIFLKQDNYPGLTDLEILRGITSKGSKPSIVGFANIVSKVTTFAEWEWKEDRKIWPKDAMISLVGTKQRRLKKLILGDAIWSLLYQLIFCSPFRILGEEGKNLEEGWNGLFPSDEDEFSNEYRWPTPSVICEKYRWDTCEAALNSLTKPSSPYNPLRSSFVNNQPQFNERFLSTVEAYVELTEKREQDLLKFLTEVVRMWLIFCNQRYRIRMILPGSSESDPEKKMKLAKEQNDLKFTVAPRLQRHGNAKGAQLQEVSVVSGCDGKTATVHESQS